MAEFDGWAILELMGHRKLGGHVREVELAGAPFLRIDVPGDGEGDVVATQFYAPGAVYAITPTTEATARALARIAKPAPVTPWELPPASRVGPIDVASEGEYFDEPPEDDDPDEEVF